jgi:methionine sulfoxide reductase heme-binding subunit
MINAFRQKRDRLLHLAVHLGAIFPLAWLIWDFSTDNLTADPIRAATLRTGMAAIVLLILTLAVTPFYTVFGYKPILTIRRTLGLYTFLYVSIHFLIFIGVDYGFDISLLKDALFEKRYALVGLATALILLPLAITSTRGWMKRLGRKWKQLHRLIYVASLLAVIHFVWLVKGDPRQPLLYGLVVVLLLLARVPAVRKRLAGLRRSLVSKTPKFIKLKNTELN